MLLTLVKAMNLIYFKECIRIVGHLAGQLMFLFVLRHLLKINNSYNSY